MSKHVHVQVKTCTCTSQNMYMYMYNVYSAVSCSDCSPSVVLWYSPVYLLNYYKTSKNLDTKSKQCQSDYTVYTQK